MFLLKNVQKYRKIYKKLVKSYYENTEPVSYTHLFVVKPGFQNAALVPALIGVCGGLGAGIAYTMVRVLGTHGVKGPVIVFYFSFFSCLSVVPWMLFHFTPMSMKPVSYTHLETS